MSLLLKLLTCRSQQVYVLPVKQKEHLLFQKNLLFYQPLPFNGTPSLFMEGFDLGNSNFPS